VSEAGRKGLEWWRRRRDAIASTDAILAMGAILSIGAFALGCGTATTKGQDCPEPAQLLAGVSVQCGSRTVVGTLLAGGAASCTEEGQTDCLLGGDFKAVSAASINAGAIKEGVTIAGVAGTLKTIEGQSYVECAIDGDQDCVVRNDLAAANLDGIEPKIVKGKMVAGVSGSGVISKAPECSSLGEIGCLTNNDYVPITASQFTECVTNQ
jgi:hypothetical protein